MIGDDQLSNPRERVTEFFGESPDGSFWASVRLEREVDGSWVEDNELHVSVMLTPDRPALVAMLLARELWRTHAAGAAASPGGAA